MRIVKKPKDFEYAIVFMATALHTLYFELGSFAAIYPCLPRIRYRPAIV